jgi:hypothetical protein
LSAAVADIPAEIQWQLKFLSRRPGHDLALKQAEGR